jgi:hypothetical protein
MDQLARPRSFSGSTFLEDPQAKRLVEETPLRLTRCTKRTREIFSTLLDLARLDGFWNGREVGPS